MEKLYPLCVIALGAGVWIAAALLGGTQHLLLLLGGVLVGHGVVLMFRA